VPGAPNVKAETTGRSNSVPNDSCQEPGLFRTKLGREGTDQWREEVSHSRRSTTGLEDIDGVLEEVFVPGMCHDLGDIVSQTVQLAGSNHAKSGRRKVLRETRVHTSVNELLRRLINDVMRRMLVRVTNINLFEKD
jgi:hypothetical protein